MARNWYVLHSNYRKEELLFRQVQVRGIEVYYPQIPVHPVNPRAHKIKAYFPGYMFVQIDPEATAISVFQSMPFSGGLVAFGGEPAAVADSFVQVLRKRVDAVVTSGGEIFQGLKHGDEVVIQTGPFAQYEAIFDYRKSGTERVRLLLKMLNKRILPVELDVSQIEKIKDHRP